MLRKSLNGLNWLEFHLLAEQPRLKHAIFLRSTNLGPYSGDEKFVSNLELVQQTLGLPEIIWPHQCHGDQVLEVKKGNIAGQFECDGLMTSELDLGLMVNHADCQTAIFYDPVHHAVATVHAGWRGSVQNIYAKTIEALKKRYATNPKDLLVCISPSLGPEHAEFVNYKTELPGNFWEFQVKPNYFDFWQISRKQLLEEGVLSEHIEVAEMCTYANASDFFSYRRDNSKERHGTIVSLK